MNSPLLIVDNCLSSVTGVRAVAEDLAERLSATGWPVLLTSCKPGRLSRFFDMLLSAWKWRGKYKIANVVVYSGLAFIWAEAVCWLLRRMRKPYVLTLQGGNLPGFANKWPGRASRLFRSAAVVTTPSRYLLEELSQYCERMLLIPNPVNLDNYRFQLRHRPSPRIVWLRAFHVIYNPALAPRVLSLLASEFPDIHLTMIGPDKGDGSAQATLRTAQELKIEDRINFTGAVPKPDVPERLNQGDIFLNTTNVDNMPVSMLEAMACGLCVVSTNVGGIPYLLNHQQDALLVPPDDAEAMASAVRRILTEPDLAVALSKQGRLKTEQLDWASVIKQWESVLMDLEKSACER
ncbi:MAG TPA: glycosyltransferase family 4 protein [Blastocatellia bacterium]|nr:glycosyltransferase family 4 protein [Blastocatellia bacterium]